MDFYSLVKAINNSSASKKINLYYFKEVEVEVKNFFSAAQKIIRGQPNSYINSQAMIDITRGVNEVSEIINKESHFFDLLKGMGIKPYDRIEMSDENLIKYNVTSKDLIDKYGYSDLKTEEVIQSILVTFTKLNYLRKGKNSENLENIGHLIVSGKSLTKSLSLDNESKFNEKDFSFASDIYYLTEKLWYKLHKGLGFKGSLPITFDAVTKAQIIVSNKINLKARERFDQLKLDVQSGSENEQSVKEYYLNLRSYCIKPEELTSENVESKAMFIYDDTTPEEFAKEILMIKSENEELKRFKKKVEESKDKERALKIEEFQKKIQKKILSNYKKYELIKLVANILYYFVLLILIIILIYLCIKSKETCFNTLNTVMAVVSFLYFLGIKKFKIYVERFCNNKHAKYKLDIEKNTQNL